MIRTLASAIGILLLTQSAGAQTVDEQREAVNKGTVGVVTGRADSLFARLGDDLGLGLDGVVGDNREILRILSISGGGSLQNVEDLLLLRGVDFAFTQSDVLDFMQEVAAYENLKSNIHYVAKLPSEEMHLLGRVNINNIRELEGKRVNFGKERTGSFLTASVVFDKLGIAVEVTSFPHGEAYKKLLSGEIDAMVKVDGKPVKVITNASLDDAVHLIDVPQEELAGVYDPASFSSDDYPKLLPTGDSVKTVSVSGVLAAYNFRSNADRRQRSDRFIKQLYANIDKLRDPANGFDNKWTEIDLTAEVPGWTRAEAASQYLASQ